MDCCARRDAGDRGSTAGSGHGDRAQDTVAAGLRAEAAQAPDIGHTGTRQCRGLGARVCSGH